MSRNLFFFFILLNISFVSAQDLDQSSIVVNYQTLMVKDTIRNRTYTDNLSLLIGSSYSLFYSEKWEALTPKYKELVLDSNPLNILVLNVGSRIVILNNYKESKLQVLESLQKNNYTYNLPNNFLNWKITNENKNLLGYNCQKAITAYGGREWTAWFTPDIPVPEGPWLFKGLPGLILEVFDSQNYFRFTAAGIEKKILPINFNDAGYIKTSKEKVNEQLYSYQSAAVRTASSYLNSPELSRNLEAAQIENIKSSMMNNFIEKNKATSKN